MQDLAFPDGQIFIPGLEAVVTAGAVTITRSGLGLLVASMAAAQTVTLDFNISKALFRTGMQDDAQQAFGQASLTSGIQGQQGLAAPPTSFKTPYQQSGRPPYTQATNMVVPTSRPKGIGILSITPIYTISTLALTSISLGLTKTVFSDLAAPVVTALLAAGANGLRTATSAQPNIKAVTVTNQAMITDLYSQVIAELTFVLPATSTAVLYGLSIGVQFNHN